MAKAKRWIVAASFALGAGMTVSAKPARADLQLCNRMSYVIETAIGLEEKGNAVTRGWFRIDPGQCRMALQGAVQADQLYVNARVRDVYGPSPLPQSGHADFCVTAADFAITGAKKCTRQGQNLARFTAVKPSEHVGSSRVYLAEDAEYTDEQARDAGIQRLLVIAGYDATPIDGIRGAKTDAALSQFLQDNKLANTAAGRSDFFDILLEAAQKPGIGFSWCNDTKYTVMAALGVEDKGNIVTRGWYRIEPGKCLRPEVRGHPLLLYSFAEAVDPEGRAIDKTLSWGGSQIMCTRHLKFELTEQTDCASKGLSSAGFASVDLAGHGGVTLRFK
jgi:uncharacterized membrane protein